MTAPVNLGDFIDRTGDPERPQVIDAGPGGTERVTTRRALDGMADAFARGLASRGLERGDRIAILSANRAEYVAVVLGAMRAGVVPVPVNHKFAAATIRFVIGDCGAKLVVCDAQRRPQLPADLAADLRIIAFDDADSSADWLDPGPFEPIVPRPDETALILYTSGSTGRPKGVRLSHASHLWVAQTRVGETNLSGERFLIAAPLYHMNALSQMLTACAGGATAILLLQFEAKLYIEAIRRYRCTFLTAVPPMIAMILNEKDALRDADLSSVRGIRMGSAPVNDALAQATRALLPNARIINAYGTTEGGPIVFTDRGGQIPPGSLGRPHPQVEVRLAGEDAHGVGVLQMKSPAIMLGYHDRPDAPSPITADGFYDTGDVFRRDADGFFFFVGRVDDMFVSGGENIFPGEVETVIETHPDVLQAAVVPVDDAIKGAKPVAFVVARPGATIDEDGVKRHVLANAPAFQHPRRVWFVAALPLAATNKIDRKALLALAEAELKTAAA